MAEDKDFNDVLDDIFLCEETQHKESYDEGFKAGSDAGNPEGYHLGYHRGAEIGRELGFYSGIINHHINLSEHSSTQYTDKIINQLKKVVELITAFPETNSEEHDIFALLESIRAQYKKACALLKIPSNNPYGTGVSF
ncbi:protein LTO1 homolog [Plutella xylostella]|uniref:protein LTO1 homolog n=1 Tax=Plutella xylostella TaxID=51655 RepID=UPI0020330DDC|nr:protein LTO1 homolog [Plutella xylostella]